MSEHLRNAGSPFWWGGHLHSHCGPFLLQLGASSTAVSAWEGQEVGWNSGLEPASTCWAMSSTPSWTRHASGRTPRNSKGSIGSISTIESQRVTSKKSSQYAAPKALKDTRSLLKPPQNEIGCNSSNVSNCSGTWSTTSSNSHTFWAEPAPNGPNGRHGHHQDLSGRSTRKISKVQPMWLWKQLRILTWSHLMSNAAFDFAGFPGPFPGSIVA